MKLNFQTVRPPLVFAGVLLVLATSPVGAIPSDSKTGSSAVEPPRVQRYTLTEFLNTVMARSPAILSAELDAQSVDYIRKATQAAYFPKLEAHGSTGYIKGASIAPFLNPGATNASRANGFVDFGGGSLAVPIFSEGTFLGIDAPKVNIALAAETIANNKTILTKDEIRFRATSVYLDAIVQSKEANWLKPKLAALDSQVKILQVKQTYHLISEQEIQNLQAQEGEVAALSQQARWLAVSTLIQVAELLGVDDASRVQIDTRYPNVGPIPDYQTVLTHTLLSHPLLATQQAVIAQAQAQHTLDESAFLPRVDVVNSYDWGDNYDPPGDDRWLSTLMVSLPIFDGGENYYKVRASSKQLEAEKDRLYQTKLDLEASMQNAYSTLQQANVSYYTSLALYNEKALILHRDEIMDKLGEVPASDYLNAKIAYADAAYAAETSHFQLLLACANLEKISSGAWKWPIVVSR